MHFYLIYEKNQKPKYKFNAKKVSKIYICLGFLIKGLWIEAITQKRYVARCLLVSYRKSSLFYSLASNTQLVNTVACCTNVHDPCQLKNRLILPFFYLQ